MNAGRTNKAVQADLNPASMVAAGKKTCIHENRPAGRGFSLIEILIAMAIFSIGILAITSLQIKSINQNAAAMMQTAATTIAVDWMEQLISRPYSDPLLDEANSPYQAQSGNYTIVWVVKEDPKNYGLPIKQIDIQVTGANPNAQAVNLTSIKWQGTED